MFNKLKKFFSAPVAPVKVTKPRKPKAVKVPEVIPEVKTDSVAKEKATAAGEPYIVVTEMDIDPNNINAGSMTFDWNDKFLLNLIKAGYKMKEDDTENMIVDRWFHTICRNVVLEIYEQEQSDPDNRDVPPLTKSGIHPEPRSVGRKSLDGGRVEIS